MIFTIRFDPVGMELVGKALHLLPHGQVRGLIDDIQAQINAQEAAAAKASSETAGPNGAEAPAPAQPNRRERRAAKARARATAS